MLILDLKDKQEYLEEVMTLEYDEWADNKEQDRDLRIKNKINKYFERIEDKYFVKLILLNEDKLIGFISIFPMDSEEEIDLTPWYATMYVKEEHRGKGYSKLLNDAILKEAKRREISTIYLKTTLENYYEKFGAKYIKDLASGEKLLKFDII